MMNSPNHQPLRINTLLAGRDLAVEMLHEAERLSRSGAASIEASDRCGARQNVFLRKYLERLAHTPDLRDGFAAVLSDLLAGPRLDAVGYAQLSLHDMVGVPGSDAT